LKLIHNHYNNFIDWDVPNWARALMYLDSKKSVSFKDKKVLEIGARDGDLSLWAAIKGANVICSDIIGPSESFVNRISLYKLENIKFKALDVLNLPFSNKFDYVLFKSVLGGIGKADSIENQSIVMKQIYQVLKPGGECLFMENMSATWLHNILRKKFGAGLTNWYYPSLMEFYELSKIFNKVSYRTFGYIGLGEFPLKNFRSKLDSYLEKIIDPSCHYIYAGVYQK